MLFALSFWNFICTFLSICTRLPQGYFFVCNHLRIVIRQAELITACIGAPSVIKNLRSFSQTEDLTLPLDIEVKIVFFLFPLIATCTITYISMIIGTYIVMSYMLAGKILIYEQRVPGTHSGYRCVFACSHASFSIFLLENLQNILLLSVLHTVGIVNKPCATRAAK